LSWVAFPLSFSHLGEIHLIDTQAISLMKSTLFQPAIKFVQIGEE
jgi:hypothetical protein